MKVRPCIKAPIMECEETFEVYSCEKKCHYQYLDPTNFCDNCGGEIGIRKVTEASTKSYLDLLGDSGSMTEVLDYEEFAYIFANDDPQDIDSDIVEVCPNSLIEDMEDFKKRYAKEIEIIKQASGGDAMLIHSIFKT